jgi:hypothetical protein
MKIFKSFLISSLFTFSAFGQTIFNYDWTAHTGGPDYDYVKDVTMDNEGNYYYFMQTYSDSCHIIDSSYYGSGLYVVKLDSNRTLDRVKYIACSDYIVAMTIKVVNDGDIYLMGWFKDTAYFDQNIIVDTSGSGVSFMAKMDFNGNYNWINIADHSPDFVAYKMIVDEQENIYITGIMEDNFMIVGGDTVFSTLSTYNLPVIKYDSNGFPIWGILACGSSFTRGTGMDFDPDGNIHIIGDFHGDRINFGQDSIVTHFSHNLLLTSLTPDGNFNRLQIIEYDQSLFFDCIKINELGNIFITGTIEGDLYFQEDTIHIPGFFEQFCVIMLSPAGNYKWHVASTSYDDYPRESAGHDIALSGTGNLFVTGIFNYELEIGNFTFNTMPYGINFDNLLVEINTSGEVLSAMQFYGQTYFDDYSNRKVFIFNDNLYFSGSFVGTGNYDNQSLTSFGYIDNFISKLTLSTVSIEEPIVNQHELIRIYSSEGQVCLDNLNPALNYNLKIMNLSGQVIEERLISGSILLHLKLNVPNGIYIVLISTAEEVQTKKILVFR